MKVLRLLSPLVLGLALSACSDNGSGGKDGSMTSGDMKGGSGDMRGVRRSDLGDEGDMLLPMGCYPTCITSLIGDCTPMGMCKQSMMGDVHKSCYDNGVVYTGTVNADMSFGFTVTKGGNLCYKFNSAVKIDTGVETYTFKDKDGNDVATIVKDRYMGMERQVASCKADGMKIEIALGDTCKSVLVDFVTGCAMGSCG